MSAKTMAAALAEHYPNYQWHRDLSENLWTCTSLNCSFTSGGFEQAIAHQAAALSAAGYGLVADAKREALEEAADALNPQGSYALQNIAKWLRARAAEMRQG